MYAFDFFVNLQRGGSFGDVSTRSKIFEMIIPGASASSVLGKSGSNLASIRQVHVMNGDS